MASIPAIVSIAKPTYYLIFPSCRAFTSLQFRFQFSGVTEKSRMSRITSRNGCRNRNFPGPTKLWAVMEEGETVVPEQEVSDQTVSVAVSSSDVLTMFFQAEGAMTDSAIPLVTKALEGVEGITDLKVGVAEGIASVELTKQTTLQATGVASNLVEMIQGSGFKLQTLNLSFHDEDDFS